MKNLSRNFKLGGIVAVCAIFPTLSANAQNTMTFKIGGETKEPIEVSDADKKKSDELDELNFVEMLNSVQLDSKSADLIRKFQEKEGRKLLEKGYGKNNTNLERYRNKEVLLVTIPASSLFAPNDTLLRPDAASMLNPLKRYLKEPDMYRVLMVMHTDNTGSPQYRDHLTEERSKAVFDWFAEQDVDTEYLFPYAFGDDMPLVENNSMSNRAQNRRLEVYLVPGKKMLEQAKKGRIVF